MNKNKNIFQFFLIFFFRFPQKDKELINQWKKAIASQTLNVNSTSGLICINHFSKSVLTKSNDLKKGAFPTIFEHSEQNTENTSCSDENNKNCDTEPLDDLPSSLTRNAVHSLSPVSPEASSSLTACESEEDPGDQLDEPDKSDKYSNEYLESQLNDLRKEYFTEQCNNNLKLLKLESKILDLQSKLQKQSDQISKLNQQLSRTEKANVSLKGQLEELQQQNLTSKRAMDVLEVIL